ncbi:MAG: hypothetical protein IKW62_04975 [Clostridia bacterium]|nr:hypothetical protein [Clostridia bacterium]
MSNKCKTAISVIGIVLSIALLAISAVLAEEAIIRPALAVTFTVISAILVFVAIFYAAKIDYETGVYECRKCGHTFKPTFKAYTLGAHTLSTRHLKCSGCGEKSWCKRKNRRV